MERCLRGGGRVGRAEPDCGRGSTNPAAPPRGRARPRARRAFRRRGTATRARRGLERGTGRAAPPWRSVAERARRRRRSWRGASRPPCCRARRLTSRGARSRASDRSRPCSCPGPPGTPPAWTPRRRGQTSQRLELAAGAGALVAGGVDHMAAASRPMRRGRRFALAGRRRGRDGRGARRGARSVGVHRDLDVQGGSTFSIACPNLMVAPAAVRRRHAHQHLPGRRRSHLRHRLRLHDPPHRRQLRHLRKPDQPRPASIYPKGVTLTGVVTKLDFDASARSTITILGDNATLTAGPSPVPARRSPAAEQLPAPAPRPSTAEAPTMRSASCRSRPGDDRLPPRRRDGGAADLDARRGRPPVQPGGPARRARGAGCCRTTPARGRLPVREGELPDHAQLLPRRRRPLQAAHHRGGPGPVLRRAEAGHDLSQWRPRAVQDHRQRRRSARSALRASTGDSVRTRSRTRWTTPSPRSPSATTARPLRPTA